jgi:hypothetical protein
MEFPDGVTYRQLRYWVGQQYLPSTLFPSDIGNPRKRFSPWTPEQQRVLTVMGQLCQFGLAPGQAGPIALQARDTEHGVLTVDIKPGLVLFLNLDVMLDAAAA